MTSHGLQSNNISPENDLYFDACDLIRATGNPVFAPALQRSCDIVRHVGLCITCDVTFASLARRELGHQVARIKAILMAA